LRQLADKGDVKYASELYKLLQAVGAEDRPEGEGTRHAICVGPPGRTVCLFHGRLNIGRKQILPNWMHAYEIALQATIEHVHNEKRARQGGDGDFAISWRENQ
jgi:hypothetical protein